MFFIDILKYFYSVWTVYYTKTLQSGGWFDSSCHPLNIMNIKTDPPMLYAPDIGDNQHVKTHKSDIPSRGGAIRALS